jgi:2-amino-4-hydroxy-6-hydroxymethyldihydropteridine diphosphokinase
VLSIGSNLGDRAANLAIAVASVRPWLLDVSPVYETPPWGPVPQPSYLNAVLIVADPQAAPTDWLARAQAAEAAARRIREVRWGPRTLDVDVVSVDDIRIETPELVLPHPRADERAFVLVPWLAVEPPARLAGRAVSDLIAGLPADEVAAVRARPDVLLSDPGPGRAEAVR